MKTTIAVLLILLAMPLAAQDRDMTITAWASQVQMQGDNQFEGFSSEFEDGTGIGLSVNRFFGRMLSVEASVFSLRNEVTLRIDESAAFIDLGKVNLTPITIGGQLHLAGRSRFDPYVGAGAAYVLAGDLHSPDLEVGERGRLELDDKLTWYANAGIGVEIVRGFALVADGRYLAYETSSRSTVTGGEEDIDFTPLLLSLGLRFQF
ncbi:MAG TPA: OmpW family outer membrane protein [Thermoanaerobaculia bacterium]|nr:OmpW family outer membrane protein [Thermoanaerobaculia bacterium]